MSVPSALTNCDLIDAAGVSEAASPPCRQVAHMMTTGLTPATRASTGSTERQPRPSALPPPGRPCWLPCSTPLSLPDPTLHRVMTVSSDHSARVTHAWGDDDADEIAGRLRHLAPLANVGDAPEAGPINGYVEFDGIGSRRNEKDHQATGHPSHACCVWGDHRPVGDSPKRLEPVGLAQWGSMREGLRWSGIG